ncbi:hypothetical protein RUM44_000109 [Polyplax serrata]|uniref:Uncharacterized protein n=1 Tax=Polyplax serrata TaxID=468196 RepID=A0ABR1B638_POLSC
MGMGRKRQWTLGGPQLEDTNGSCKKNHTTTLKQQRVENASSVKISTTSRNPSLASMRVPLHFKAGVEHPSGADARLPFSVTESPGFTCEGTNHHLPLDLTGRRKKIPYQDRSQGLNQYKMPPLHLGVN